ncbi:MAG: (Fe-S)-binding protein, partial [Thermodesulfobacteriota bacterium]|nr:(Fe-S)-binding protein [Thermodesulfobacteriota bacterium]
MDTALISPASAYILGIPAVVFSVLIPVAGTGVFAYIIAKRLSPLLSAAPDPRLDRFKDRFIYMLKYAIGQYRQPRYLFAGIIHIIIFAGFMILSIHSVSLVLTGISEGFAASVSNSMVGHIYGVLKDVASTFVLLACVIAIVRRGIFKPERYSVPPEYGKDHTKEAIFVLMLISTLMVCDMLFEASLTAAGIQKGLGINLLIPGTGTWFVTSILLTMSPVKLQPIHVISYFIHDLTFFFFLCFLPMGKHFHIITSLPNIFFMKLKKGTVKPVMWGIAEEKLDDLDSFGIKKFSDFTWKHMLDFYTCADCGRCSDQCPANAVGRPLSPRFVSIKCRDYVFKKYPLFRDTATNNESLIGNIFTEDEIWSCTTCGACEAECPLMIEYIDKIVDLRRGMVDNGIVPQSLQKPLHALEKRGNPYGKMEKKRSDWTKEKDFSEKYKVKIVGKKEMADALYFADSITSFDDRMQEIARSAVRVLHAAGVDFGILGAAEKDSGNEVRRFGEEMLFQELKDQNTDAILSSGVKRIVTTDPHAFNSLKNDYKNIPPVEHISQVIARKIKAGAIRLNGVKDSSEVYTYHDPCYLGRHNGIYDAPRDVIDAIPGITRIEMDKSRDRSFCCGGGGLMLFYEPIEEKRMGQLRVEMAKEAGATVIVTACPFCMANIEDAIK